MRLLDRINQFLVLILDTFRQFSNWRAWGILLAFLLLNWLVLLAHREYIHAPFYAILSPWINLFGENRARAVSHYPQSYFLMPGLFGWSKLLLGIVLEALVLGAVARLLHRGFAHGRRSGGGRSVLSLWGHLLVIWLVLTGLNYDAGYFLPGLVAPYVNGPRRLFVFSFVAMPFVFTFLFSLLIFALPAVVVHGDNAGKAIIRSLRIFLRRPFMCFFLSIFVLALPLLIGSILNRPVDIADRFRPELIYWLLVAKLILETVANFFWMGAAVRFMVEPEDDQ